jgi:hypothetical protein
VLSNYASTDSVTWLTTTLDALQTVPAVRTELEQGREVGYAYLEHALDVLDSGGMGLLRLHRSSSNRTIQRFRTVSIPVKSKPSWLHTHLVGRS